MEDAEKKIVIYDPVYIRERIFTLREAQVMIDRDLAYLYEVSTKVLNQAVKRNLERFPEVFRFQLNDNEKHELVTNCDRFEKLKHSSVNPFAFTEQGVAMLSAVLRSKTAVNVSIQIMQAFVEMKRFITANATIFQRLERIELKQIETDQKFEELFKALEDKGLKPRQGIFFNGQIFDAYKFVSNLVRNAKESILLIDNYIDETVLDLFSKKRKTVKVTILTAKITRVLIHDVEKFNDQYPSLELKEFIKAHDRFLIIDDKDVYHFGASLKDLGKKWFAFSKMDKAAFLLLENLKKVTKNE